MLKSLIDGDVQETRKYHSQQNYASSFTLHDLHEAHCKWYRDDQLPEATKQRLSNIVVQKRVHRHTESLGNVFVKIPPAPVPRPPASARKNFLEELNSKFQSGGVKLNHVPDSKSGVGSANKVGWSEEGKALFKIMGNKFTDDKVIEQRRKKEQEQYELDVTNHDRVDPEEWNEE